MPSHLTLGKRGEDVAVAYLKRNGYHVMDRNYRFEQSEVDVVAYQPTEDNESGQLVFVEVKTRSSLNFGAPEEAVTEAKQQAVRKGAQAYLYERQLEGSPARFDVIGVVLRQGREPEIQHFENAFM